MSDGRRRGGDPALFNRDEGDGLEEGRFGICESAVAHRGSLSCGLDAGLGCRAERLEEREFAPLAVPVALCRDLHRLEFGPPQRRQVPAEAAGGVEIEGAVAPCEVGHRDVTVDDQGVPSVVERPIVSHDLAVRTRPRPVGIAVQCVVAHGFPDTQVQVLGEARMAGEERAAREQEVGREAGEEVGDPAFETSPLGAKGFDGAAERVPDRDRAPRKSRSSLSSWLPRTTRAAPAS